jgi:bifunctional non-homologous end joining protein LigD
MFEQLGLRCYPKTSGSKGVQVYVPLHTDVTYDETKPFAKAVAETLARNSAYPPDAVFWRTLSG